MPKGVPKIVKSKALPKDDTDYPTGRGRNGKIGLKRPDVAERMKGKKYALGLTKDVCPNVGRPKKYTDEWIEEEADILLQWIKNDTGVYIGTFAYERGYCRQNLTEFAQKSKKFSDALSVARAWQEQKFIEKGLTKEWDATQVRYTMARVCGDIWKASYDRDESDKEVTLNINVTRLID